MDVPVWVRSGRPGDGGALPVHLGNLPSHRNRRPVPIATAGVGGGPADLAGLRAGRDGPVPVTPHMKWKGLSAKRVGSLNSPQSL